MKRLWLALFLGWWASAALAQVPGPSCGYNSSQPCSVSGTVTSAPSATTGNGTLAATSSSALINTMTVNSSGAALPATLNSFVVINTGTTDAALCKNTSSAGATCTCPENGVASTNGVTIPGYNGGYSFNLGGVSSANPTVVMCSGTGNLQFQW